MSRETDGRGEKAALWGCIGAAVGTGLGVAFSSALGIIGIAAFGLLGAVAGLTAAYLSGRK